MIQVFFKYASLTIIGLNDRNFEKFKKSTSSISIFNINIQSVENKIYVFFVTTIYKILQFLVKFIQ